MMIFVNEATNSKTVTRGNDVPVSEEMGSGPVRPHLAEELWKACGRKGTHRPWPLSTKIRSRPFPGRYGKQVVIQVNGKLREKLDVTAASTGHWKSSAPQTPKLQKALEGIPRRRGHLVTR